MHDCTLYGQGSTPTSRERVNISSTPRLARCIYGVIKRGSAAGSTRKWELGRFIHQNPSFQSRVIWLFKGSTLTELTDTRHFTYLIPPRPNTLPSWFPEFCSSSSTNHLSELHPLLYFCCRFASSHIRGRNNWAPRFDRSYRWLYSRCCSRWESKTVVRCSAFPRSCLCRLQVYSGWRAGRKFWIMTVAVSDDCSVRKRPGRPIHIHLFRKKMIRPKDIIFVMQVSICWMYVLTWYMTISTES